MSEPSYILTDNSLTVFHDGIHTCTSDHRHWDAIIDALKDEDFPEVIELMKPVNAIRTFTKDSGITIEGSTVFYDGEPLRGVLVDRILTMREQGFNVDPMVQFLTNLMDNPSYRSREQLYTFLEHNQMPLTYDGCFMAYKRVNDDFLDLHSGSMNNRPGSIVEMPRAQVDDDPNRTCSAGLHVCSREYLRSFHGSKLVACKVNPRDVVSVPTDYQFTKMRVCRYEVVEELPITLVDDGSEHWKQAVYPVASDDWEDPDYYPDEDYPD